MHCMYNTLQFCSVPVVNVIDYTRMFTYQFNDVANDGTILYASNTCMQLYMCQKALNMNTSTLINIITWHKLWKVE